MGRLRASISNDVSVNPTPGFAALLAGTMGSLAGQENKRVTQKMLTQARRDAKRQALAEAGAAAEAAAASALPSPTAGMTSKEKAVWSRAFRRALLSPEAKACGLAQAAASVKQNEPRKKRAAHAALAVCWHTYGFDSSKYSADEPAKKKPACNRSRSHKARWLQLPKPPDDAARRVDMRARFDGARTDAETQLLEAQGAKHMLDECGRACRIAPAQRAGRIRILCALESAVNQSERSLLNLKAGRPELLTADSESGGDAKAVELLAAAELQRSCLAGWTEAALQLASCIGCATRD